MIQMKKPVIDLEDHLPGMLERLREVREKSHYPSLRQFATHVEEMTGLEVTGSAIRRYELGLMRAPLDYALAVALATGTDANWLLRGTGERRHQPTSDDTERLASTLIDLAERLKKERGAGSYLAR